MTQFIFINTPSIRYWAVCRRSNTNCITAARAQTHIIWMGITTGTRTDAGGLNANAQCTRNSHARCTHRIASSAHSTSSFTHSCLSHEQCRTQTAAVRMRNCIRTMKCVCEANQWFRTIYTNIMVLAGVAIITIYAFCRRRLTPGPGNFDSFIYCTLHSHAIYLLCYSMPVHITNTHVSYWSRVEHLTSCTLLYSINQKNTHIGSSDCAQHTICTLFLLFWGRRRQQCWLSFSVTSRIKSITQDQRQIHIYCRAEWQRIDDDDDVCCPEVYRKGANGT